MVNAQFLFIAHNGHWIIASSCEKPRTGRKREREKQEASKDVNLNSVETYGCLILHYPSIGNVIENTEARLRCQYRPNIFILHTFTLRESERLLISYSTNESFHEFHSLNEKLVEKIEWRL